MRPKPDPLRSVAIVTGGGRGIGRAVCRRFAADGAHVVAMARSSGELDAAVDACRAAGGTGQSRPVDVSDVTRLAEAIADIAEDLGRIDVLVNCAGAAALGGVETLPMRALDDMLNVNVRAVFVACQAVWPIFVRQRRGVIVNVSSVASKDPFPGLGAYGACKAWVNTWTVGLANEGRPLGIRVFGVAPGAVETRMLRDHFPDFPADQCLSPDDVADVIYALSRPECRCASGQTVFVRR
ncbi:MAG: SDR family oxidoreductase [Phycisphaerales bacterium]|nr:MAG: SDR family oxidoreductase [Phycisphaerales bacterium]